MRTDIHIYLKISLLWCKTSKYIKIKDLSLNLKTLRLKTPLNKAQDRRFISYLFLEDFPFLYKWEVPPSITVIKNPKQQQEFHKSGNPGRVYISPLVFLKALTWVFPHSYLQKRPRAILLDLNSQETKPSCVGILGRIAGQCS